MNRAATLIGLFIFVSLFFNCGGCEDCTGDGNYKIRATVKFINETSSNITSIGCDREIVADSTFKLELEETLGTKPNINTFPVSIFTNCSMAYTDGTKLKCEDGIRNIENYIDRKEISPLVFEFTFKFTEEKKSVAKVCN